MRLSRCVDSRATASTSPTVSEDTAAAVANCDQGRPAGTPTQTHDTLRIEHAFDWSLAFGVWCRP